MNKEKFDYLGITKFHEAGFLGEGITVASIENGRTSHSKKVEDVLKQILPKAKIISNVKYWRDDEVLFELDGYTCSQVRSDADDIEKVEKAKELSARNVFMTCAIGNEYDESYSKLAKYNEWVSVGACKYNERKTKIRKLFKQKRVFRFCFNN